MDTSSLICLSQKYPENIFETLYINIDKSIHNDIIKAPYRVFAEIKKRDDFLYKWLKKYKNPFLINMNEPLIKSAFSIINKFPELIKNKGLENTEDDPADPYLIATAIKPKERLDNEPVKIITEKGLKKNHIPDIAEKYGITSINILEFFTEMKWKF
ncbi:DUF4411 family protein [Ferroplasma acidiphilum]|uniref:DUF4411 family protein n=1 Tax=Ferroplasma acidiphilum TaxID=74969 RepID=UPI0030196E49